MLVLVWLAGSVPGALCLWARGVVHYAIDPASYDVHSADMIAAALSELQREVCVQFFSAGAGEYPGRGAGAGAGPLLAITNPGRRRECAPQTYNFSSDVVELAVGYDCVRRRDVARIATDMLRASIEPAPAISVNSYDLVKKFQEQDTEREGASSALLSPSDRNYINAHYHAECEARGGAGAGGGGRREGAGPAALSEENSRYYADKLWPLGVVLYAVEDSLRGSDMHLALRGAMTALEMVSCVVFEEAGGAQLRARALLWFGREGAAAPQLGYREGNQSVSLSRMCVGAAGHASHTLGLLLRALGLPMVSNRHDRDTHVLVHWQHVQRGLEHLLAKTPPAATLPLPYDYASATHAPPNYACGDCSRGQATVEPALDRLWQRALSLGRSTAPSPGDAAALTLLYGAPCRQRLRPALHL